MGRCRHIGVRPTQRVDRWRIAGGQTWAEAEADHESLLGLAADGRLAGATRVVPFDELPDALDAVDRAEAVGKLVVHVTDVDT